MSSQAKLIAAICSFLFLSIQCACARELEKQSAPFGSSTRTWLLHAPVSAGTGAASLPLFVVLHGGGQDSEGIAEVTKFHQVLGSRAFVVYPQGVEKRWNDGRTSYPPSPRDDVGFLASLVDQLKNTYSIDPARVFVLGPSNGGLMTFRMLCERGELFAGGAAVIVNMSRELLASCNPVKKTPILLIAGTADQVVPYSGGRLNIFGSDRGEVISAAETLQFWLRHNACSPVSQATNLPDLNPDDDSTVQFTLHSQCERGADVALYTVVGGGHRWPSLKPPPRIKNMIANAAFGTQNRDFDATRVIAEFLLPGF